MPQPDLLLRPLDDLAPLPGPLIRLLDAAAAQTAARP